MVGTTAQSNAPKRARANAGKPTSHASAKKEKLFHPMSRKAGQLERAQLRTTKLAAAKSKRSKVRLESSDRHVFFCNAISPDVSCLSLQEVHEIIRDIWLHRHDNILAEEEAKRRKGQPRSMKSERIYGLMEAEKEEYRTGMEILDLTDPLTVSLLREWDDGDPAYLHLCRFIRVSSTDPDKIVIASRGRRELEIEAKAKKDAEKAAKKQHKLPDDRMDIETR
ncbi:hypothetical protein FRB94_007463 [Tulasnella sp. JGI-2019a]|nr:hypothetical protein FRB94_007463 [Tulasnella sp. JGI-2019a]KAG9018398.1 hypothetical protein FRB93_000101 [Tulasnella sp. JGI-2019a]KAG9037547.1 hypothetical protein FRB95_005129 [Tulasnella sp. JGI-2019a]